MDRDRIASERESAVASSPSLPPPPAPDVRTMLGFPVALTVVGVLVRVIDEVVAKAWLGGEHISLGPLRLAWLAAASSA